MMRRRPAFLLTLAVLVALDLAPPRPVSAQRVEAIEPNRGGTLDLSSQDPAIALEHLHTAEGYVIELFASEQDFPIGNPMSLTFDARGRLWVLTMPSYPQRLPDEEPDDKIVILEDRDRDGRADHHTVFAGGLHVPTGFELGDGGVYVAQQPNLVFLKDTDGDDRADVRETLLHGFGTEDSHHSISAFTWGPGGALYFQEGTFHHSQVETPWGPVRLVDAGVFRYEPLRHWLEVFVSYPFANPWGHVFDRWGQSFIADASGGANYFGTAISGNAPYPMKRRPMKVFTSIVRPTAGAEIVTSRHFPPEAQGNFLINNTIGFQGIKQHRMFEQGSGFSSEEVEPLVYSTDINFRPVDLQFGPDGALYLVDWFNPLVGHMQYSLRDPRRDTGHGRIWRVRYADRPLLEPPEIEGASVMELLTVLESYEDRVRYRARRALRVEDRDEVLAAIPVWLARSESATVAPGDTDGRVVLSPGEHKQVEALWLHQMLDQPDVALLDRVLRSNEPRARAAATRVLRFWRQRIDGVEARLARAIADPFPRVRLEALLASSYLETEQAATIALGALDQPTDYYLDYVLGETIDTLERYWLPGLEDGRLLDELPDRHLQYLLARLDTETLTGLESTRSVLAARFLRDDTEPELAASALTAYVAGSTDSRAATLVDLLGEALSKDLERATRQITQALMELSRVELGSLRDRLFELESAAVSETSRQLVRATLLTADPGIDSEIESIADGDRPLSSTLTLIGAIARTPASVQQVYYDSIIELSLELPDSLERQLDTPIDRVHLELLGHDNLRISEVELVSEGRNRVPELGARARQSSTANDAEAGRAIDGSTGGQASDLTSTTRDQNPWLDVELERSATIDQIVVHTGAVEQAGPFPASRLRVRASRGNHEVFSFEGFPPVRDRRIEIDPRVEIRRRAIRTLAELSQHRGRTIATLIELAGDPALATSALDALASTSLAVGFEPGSGLTPDRTAELAEILAAQIERLPLSELASSSSSAWFDLAERLADSLFEEETAERLRSVMAAQQIQQVTLRPVPHQMVFDTLEFSVSAARPVELRLDNQDIMPHNLVVAQIGGLEDVGKMAEAMAQDDPVKAEQRNYIPRAQVLWATRLVNPGASATLTFIAPETAGRYPFVCTFPGHWILMNGIMNVVPAGEDVPQPVLRRSAESMTSSIEMREFVEGWTLERLQPAVEQSAQGRWATRDQIEHGSELFAQIGCQKCHRKNGQGGEIGPSLDDLAERYSAVETLLHILKPSHLVAEEYETTIVETRDGGFYSGLEVATDESTVTLRANPLDPSELATIERSQIVEMSRSPLSPMPSGLLVTLSQEEILDLLRFLRSTRPLAEQP